MIFKKQNVSELPFNICSLTFIYWQVKSYSRFLKALIILVLQNNINNKLCTFSPIILQWRHGAAGHKWNTCTVTHTPTGNAAADNMGWNNYLFW